METFLQIGLYSVLVLGGLSVAAAAFMFVGIWVSDQSEETDAH